MTRHYSAGRLVSIECNQCGVLIAPSPRIAESGWMKCGVIQHGNTLEWDYCPAHAHIAEQFTMTTPEDTSEGRGIRE